MTETSWELEESNRHHSNPQGAMKGQSVPCLAEQSWPDGVHEIGAWERRTRGHQAPWCGGAMGNSRGNRPGAAPAPAEFVLPSEKREGGRCPVMEGQSRNCTWKWGKSLGDKGGGSQGAGEVPAAADRARALCGRWQQPAPKRIWEGFMSTAIMKASYP